MCKRYRVLMAVCIFALLATGALAQERAAQIPAPNTWNIELIEEGSFPGDRDLYLYSYTITDPIDIYFHNWVFEDHVFNCYCDVPPYAPLPAGAIIMGLGWDDLRLTTYGWVYGEDIRWGYTFWDQVDNEVGYVGVTPFNVASSGTFGPGSGYVDVTAYPEFQLPPPNDPFCFWTFSIWNPGEGVLAANWTTGTLYVYIESPVVSSEAVSLTSVKSLFR